MGCGCSKPPLRIAAVEDSVAEALLELSMADPVDTLMRDETPAFVQSSLQLACEWYDKWVLNLRLRVLARDHNEQAAELPTGASSPAPVRAVDSIRNVPFPPVYLLQQQMLKDAQLHSASGTAAAKYLAGESADGPASSRVLDLLTHARNLPKIAELDPFTKILFRRLIDVSGSIQEATDHSTAVGYNVKRLGFTPVPIAHADTTNSMGMFLDAQLPNAIRDTLPRARLDCELHEGIGIYLPKFSEELRHGLWEQTKTFLGTKLRKWLLEEHLALFDEPLAGADSPKFFDSDAEAAVYFTATILPYMPRTSDVDYLCVERVIQGEVHAMVFGGVGQWYLKKVTWHDGAASWHAREASDACQTPEGTWMVVDMSGLAQYEVRASYEPYGAALFFDEHRNEIAIWIEAERQMYYRSKGSSEWQYALWRFKVTLYFLAFAVTHLSVCHWLVSNTMVIALREELEPDHELRKLLWPFLHGVITINYAASINLTTPYGALPRLTGLVPSEATRCIADTTKAWRYQTFGERLTQHGIEDESNLPMVSHGKQLLAVFHRFFYRVLRRHYHDDRPPSGESSGEGAAEGAVEGAAGGGGLKSVTEDEAVIAFWAKAKIAARGKDNPLALPELSLASLVDYLSTSIFYSTAVHELLGNILLDVTVPSNVSTRILPKRYFSDTRRPQATVQEWYRVISTCSSTTTLPTPQLLPEVVRLYQAYDKAGDGAMAAIYRDFATELGECGRAISADNALVEERRSLDGYNADTDGAHSITFGKFDPRRLEISVSL